MAFTNRPVVETAALGESVAPRLVAYRIGGQVSYLKLVPAPADRFWMDFTTGGWANRCLPLLIANQAGWVILNDADFEVRWTGKKQRESLEIKYAKGQHSKFVSSMFGYGIITWSIPYLFRTPPEFNLLVRGPSNYPKDGITPLDGMVETDWLPYPFTMNWKITRPFQKVKFERDEPICMVMPVKRQDVELFQPEIRNLESEPELKKSFEAWMDKRSQVVKNPQERQTTVDHHNPIQGHYIRGEGVLGERAEAHQTKLYIRSFAEIDRPPTNTELPVSSPAPPRGDQRTGLRKLLPW